MFLASSSSISLSCIDDDLVDETFGASSNDTDGNVDGDDGDDDVNDVAVTPTLVITDRLFIVAMGRAGDAITVTRAVARDDERTGVGIPDDDMTAALLPLPLLLLLLLALV